MVVEIPESCDDCYFGVCYNEKYPLKCYITGKELYPYGKELDPYKEDRLVNCPLVELYKKYGLGFKEEK